MDVPEVRYAQSGDVHLAYQVFGSGSIDIVLALGYMTNVLILWEWPALARWMERLGTIGRVIFFDRRGTGLSDDLGRPPTLDELMDDIRAVMDDVGVERAALIGAAEGGQMCITFAATYPQRTSALVLLSAYARRMAAPDYPFGFPPELREQGLEAFARKWGRQPVGLRQLVPSRADDPAVRAWYLRAQLLGGSPRAALDWYRMATELDARDVLPAVRVPTLVLHRTDDRSVPVEAGRYLADHIPGARFVEFPGDDHFVYEGDADPILEEIEEFLTGVRRGPELERVLATVLFTDIVGSTERAATLGDRRWKELLAEHDALVGVELERFRGRLVKTTGDGLLATFDGPARGIRCAQAISSRVRSLGLEVRAGLHTGEVELQGNDVRGIAVHLASRVMSLAGSGEVLASSTVKDLVVGSGVEFEDRGSHELKGVPGHWRLYSVTAA